MQKIIPSRKESIFLINDPPNRTFAKYKKNSIFEFTYKSEISPNLKLNDYHHN